MHKILKILSPSIIALVVICSSLLQIAFPSPSFPTPNVGTEISLEEPLKIGIYNNEVMEYHDSFATVLGRLTGMSDSDKSALRVRLQTAKNAGAPMVFIETNVGGPDAYVMSYRSGSGPPTHKYISDPSQIPVMDARQFINDLAAGHRGTDRINTFDARYIVDKAPTNMTSVEYQNVKSKISALPGISSEVKNIAFERLNKKMNLNSKSPLRQAHESSSLSALHNRLFDKSSAAADKKEVRRIQTQSEKDRAIAEDE